MESFSLRRQHVVIGCRLCPGTKHMSHVMDGRVILRGKGLHKRQLQADRALNSRVVKRSDCSKTITAARPPLRISQKLFLYFSKESQVQLNLNRLRWDCIRFRQTTTFSLPIHLFLSLFFTWKYKRLNFKTFSVNILEYSCRIKEEFKRIHICIHFLCIQLLAQQL